AAAGICPTAESQRRAAAPRVDRRRPARPRVPRQDFARRRAAVARRLVARPAHGASPMKTVLHDIPFARPEFDDAEAGAVAEVLKSGWVSQGPMVARFEDAFAERVGVRFAVA